MEIGLYYVKDINVQKEQFALLVVKETEESRSLNCWGSGARRIFFWIVAKRLYHTIGGYAPICVAQCARAAPPPHSLGLFACVARRSGRSHAAIGTRSACLPRYINDYYAIPVIILTVAMLNDQHFALVTETHQRPLYKYPNTSNLAEIY